MLQEIIKDQIKLKSMLVTLAYVFLMIVAAVLFSKYVDEDNLRTIVAGAGLFGLVIFFSRACVCYLYTTT